jgi:hypothetical protein
MLRVYADFNDRTQGGSCWNLRYGNTMLDEQIETLQLAKGDKVVLYQDDADFDVVATLAFEYVDVLGREAWTAAPDWSTMIRK